MNHEEDSEAAPGAGFANVSGRRSLSVEADELQAELSILLEDMQGEQGDRHEIYLRLRQVLDNMRAFGMPLPEDLVILEQELEAGFAPEVKDDGS